MPGKGNTVILLKPVAALEACEAADPGDYDLSLLGYGKSRRTRLCPRCRRVVRPCALVVTRVLSEERYAVTWRRLVPSGMYNGTPVKLLKHNCK